MGHVSSGFIRLEERCIYLRYTQHARMTSAFVHEMAMPQRAESMTKSGSRK
jgi:hypothetical protein